MSKIFPLARAKRAISKNQVFSLCGKSNLIAQEKISGISCRIILKEGRLSILNRIGFNITNAMSKKIFFKSMIDSCKKYKKLHLLCVASEEKIIIYDCIEVDEEKIHRLPFYERAKILKSLTIFDDNISYVKTYNIDKLEDLINTGVKEIILKIKDSIYPIRKPRSQEPIADWYTIRLEKDALRSVILDSFHTGQSKNDIVFRCKQYSRGKIIQVGKLRIKCPIMRNKAIKAIDSGKRLVCQVQISEFENKRFKKIEFIKRIKDKPFTSVVVDKERDLSFVEVVNIQTKKINSFKV